MPDIASCNTQRFAEDYFLTEYLSKYKGLKLSRDPVAAALDKWRLAEDQCRETNRRFRASLSRPFQGRVEGLLFAAKRKISKVLGTLHLPRVLDACKWGPGATFDHKSVDAALDKKISETISTTAPALGYIRAVVESDPHWFEAITGIFPSGPFSLTKDCFSVVRGNRLIVVPKNAKIGRVIAAEPTANSFLQQGVHQYLVHRLRSFGIDLSDQFSNWEAARRAFSELLATLDLSAASDTIARELVATLLPLDWYLLLDALRSHETQLPDKSWVKCEKFASMGNAFCFELETLIFWALAEAVRDEVGCTVRTYAYGDDIIVSQRIARDVAWIFEECGFTVNDKKSYLSGNFFESCGGHFHRGSDVTPVYQKETLRSRSELIRAHNRLMRLGLSSERWLFITRKACELIRDGYPTKPLPRIPYGCVEDGGFLVKPSLLETDPNHGYVCRVLDFKPLIVSGNEMAMLAYRLRRGVQTNARPDGRVGLNVRGAGRWRTRVRHIPFHNIVSPS
jgi:hypothetical protein